MSWETWLRSLFFWFDFEYWSFVSLLENTWGNLKMKWGFAAVSVVLTSSALQGAAQCPDYTTFSQVRLLYLLRILSPESVL